MKTSELLELPWPPSVNNYWRALGRGHVVISRAGRAYRKDVQQVLRREEVERIEGSLELVLKLFPPDRRRRDIDNTLKCLLDSCQHAGLYRDDSQVQKLTVERCGVEKDGKVLVWVEELA